jgi:hypothetical protein
MAKNPSRPGTVRENYLPVPCQGQLFLLSYIDLKTHYSRAEKRGLVPATR